MKSDVRISKRLRFSRKALRPEDTKELADTLSREFGLGTKKNAYAQFILKDSDFTQYESTDVGVFSEGGILETKRIISIKMDFHNLSEDKEVSVDLEHGQSIEVSVSGKDEAWVNHILKLIETSLSGCKEQKIWLHRSKWPLIVIFAFAIGFLSINLLEIFTSKRVSDFHPLFSVFPLRFYLPFALGFIPAYLVVDKVCSIYSHVKLITGPEHSPTEKRRKINVHEIILVGAISLAVSLIIKLIEVIFHI